MEDEIIQQAILHFGEPSQVSKAIKEMAELTTELARYQNNKGMNINIIEEIADVSIMVEQLKHLFGKELVENHISIKMRRLKLMLSDKTKVV